MDGGGARRRRLAIVGVIAAVMLAAGGWLTVFAGQRMLTAAQLVGTPGVIAVDHCVHATTGNRALQHCDGEFRSDDGGSTDPAASVHADRRPGTSVRVGRTPSGAYELLGPVAALGWAAVSLVGLSAVDIAVLASFSLIPGRPRPRRPAVVPACLGAAALLAAFAAGAGVLVDAIR